MALCGAERVKWFKRKNEILVKDPIFKIFTLKLLTVFKNNTKILIKY